MRVNLLKQIKDYKGEIINDEEREDVNGKSQIVKTPVTVRMAFERAINSIKVDPATRQAELLTTEVRNKIFQINTKLYISDEPDFTVTELAFIKERADVGFVNNPLMYGRVCEVIEGVAPAQQPVAPAATPEKGAAK